jgi:hypothetical protein
VGGLRSREAAATERCMLRQQCGRQGTGVHTSECSDVTLDDPGMAWRREREELWPLPSTLPPRTSSDPCFVSCSEFSASRAASCKNREWRPAAMVISACT